MARWAGEHVYLRSCEAASSSFPDGLIKAMRERADSVVTKDAQIDTAWITNACFPGGPAGEESACSVGDLGSIPGLGRSPGEGRGCPLQYCGLGNSMDCIVHGVAKSRTRLSDFHITNV